jgi:alkylated DNA repair dioxygenase AlkB
LRTKVAGWLGVAPSLFVHTLVARYPPGAPLGWHRDVPDFEWIAGVSLGSACVLRLRPYPPQTRGPPRPHESQGQQAQSGLHDLPRRTPIVRLDLAPRSIYSMRGPARWAWQHSVAPVRTERWSITFRTASQIR